MMKFTEKENDHLFLFSHFIKSKKNYFLLQHRLINHILFDDDDDDDDNPTPPSSICSFHSSSFIRNKIEVH